MTDQIGSNVLQRADLRGRSHVFGDRFLAGEVLAEMLRHHCPADALVLAVPAGGLPVAAAIANELGLTLDVAVVSKITPTWNTEVGYGAVASDGGLRPIPRVRMFPASLFDALHRKPGSVNRR